MTLLSENGTPGLAVIDGVDVDAVAAAVTGCEGVATLDGGPFGEVASYLPGRRVTGVVVGDGPLTGHRPVDVVIADIDDPPATLPFPVPACLDPDPGLPPV